MEFLLLSLAILVGLAVLDATAVEVLALVTVWVCVASGVNPEVAAVMTGEPALVSLK